MFVFNMAFKCVLKHLKTYVYFTSVQEETCFYSNEKFTSIKLTGDETFFLVSMLFKLNETTNIRTANREQSDLYRGLHLTSQHTHKHTLIHVFGNSYCIS